VATRSAAAPNSLDEDAKYGTAHIRAMSGKAFGQSLKWP
jgi:hypothetical protein